MSRFAILVENLGKRYRIGRQPSAGIGCWRRLRLGSGWRGGADEFIWALREVGFEIPSGQAVGIIGPNGSGKSTLLKILCRVACPTIGRAVICGRVGSLLEVGTGFHPELTGRENIYLSGAILGMRRAEIRRAFDEIVAFSEIERFLDTPVKRYSSGMYVRLAFAVAGHLNPEILLVDEVLAVGDTQFQRKCLGKMNDAARGGRTVLFVSHNLAAVRALCTRVLWLRGGRIAADGPAEDVIAAYLAADRLATAAAAERVWTDCQAPGGPEVRLRQITLRGSAGAPQSVFGRDEPITVEVGYEVCRALHGMRIVLELLTPEGLTVLASTDHAVQPAEHLPGRYVSTCFLPGDLLNAGNYTLRVGAGIPGLKVLIPATPALTLAVAHVDRHGSHFPERWPGVVCPRLKWEVRREKGDRLQGPVPAKAAGPVGPGVRPVEVVAEAITSRAS